MTLIAILILLPVLLIVAGQAGLLRGKPLRPPGVTAGKLQPPSKTQNSVSSQTALYPDHPQASYAKIEPFRYTGEGKAAFDKLAKVVAGWPRTTIVQAEAGYLHAECSTRLLKFTDDLELWLDEPNQVIHVRSSSRLGRKDLGVNRARVEALRAAAAPL